MLVVVMGIGGYILSTVTAKFVYKEQENEWLVAGC